MAACCAGELPCSPRPACPLPNAAGSESVGPAFNQGGTGQRQGQIPRVRQADHGSRGQRICRSGSLLGGGQPMRPSRPPAPALRTEPPTLSSGERSLSCRTRKCGSSGGSARGTVTQRVHSVVVTRARGPLAEGPGWLGLSPRSPGGRGPGRRKTSAPATRACSAFGIRFKARSRQAARAKPG
jgi:hypothetical protein